MNTPSPFDSSPWPLVPFGRLAMKLTRPAPQDSEVVTAFRDGFVGPRSLRRADGFTFSDQESGYQGVERGDLVFHGLDGFAGAFGVAVEGGRCTPVYHVINCPLDDHRYVAYALKVAAATGYLAAQVPSTRQRAVDMRNWATLAQLPIPRPPVDVQRRIADLLDREFAGIREVVEVRRRQVALADDYLQASRATVFEHSLQEVPRRPLRSLLDYMQDGDWIEAPDIADEGIRFIQTGNVGVGSFKEQGFRYITGDTYERLACKPVYAGDLLVSRLGSPVVRACIAPDLGSVCVTSVDVVIGRSSFTDLEYLVEFLSSPEQLSDCDSLARGATLQRLSRAQVGRILVPVPETHVQRSIAASLGEIAQDVDAARNSLEQSLALSSELRLAVLIDAFSTETALDLRNGEPAA